MFRRWENIFVILCVGRHFLSRTQITLTLQEKIDYQARLYQNFKNFCSSKDTIKKMKKASHRLKIFAIHISDKELALEYIKVLLQLNNKKTIQLKNWS